MEVGGGGRLRPNDFWMKSAFCAGIQIHFPGTTSSFYSAATKSNTERGPVKALQMLVQIALEIQFQGKQKKKKIQRQREREPSGTLGAPIIASTSFGSPRRSERLEQRGVGCQDHSGKSWSVLVTQAPGQCGAGLLSKSIRRCLIIKLLFRPNKVGFAFRWVSSWRNRCLNTSIYSALATRRQPFFFFAFLSFFTWFGSVSTNQTGGQALADGADATGATRDRRRRPVKGIKKKRRKKGYVKKTEPAVWILSIRPTVLPLVKVWSRNSERK